MFCVFVILFTQQAPETWWEGMDRESKGTYALTQRLCRQTKMELTARVSKSELKRARK